MFVRFNANPVNKNTGDCTVRAISVLLNQSWRDTHADRNAISMGVRDIIQNQTQGIQTILDKLCQQEIDALKAQNANLQTQINLANLAASQNGQTAQILADNAAQTATLRQALNPTPIPAYVVQNPNGCNCGTFNACGC